MDGQVIIGTKLDTKNLEKELKEAEKQLEQYEREAQKLTKQRAEIEIDTKDTQKELDNVNKKIEEIKNRMNEIATKEPLRMQGAEYSILSDDLTKEEAKQKELLSQISEKYSQIDAKIKENINNQGLVNYKIQQLNMELTRTKGFESIKEHIKDIGKHMDKNVKKIGRWALAIFGIRSAYMMVRQAMSTISKYDKQMATDLEYMRFAIANALKPLIEGIVELAKKLMFYVGYIAKGWFGIDIYAKSSAKDFKKANEEAKKLQKTFAKFDEMDVVSDASSQNNTPSFNLGNMQDIKVPSWLEWIAKNGDKVVAILGGIAGGLLAIKTGAGLLMGLGIGLFIFEIVMLIEDIINYLKDPTWENFYQIIGDIALIIGTIIFLLGGGGVVGAILILVGIIIKNWDKIKGIIGPIADWIYNNVIKPIGDFFKGLIDVLCAPFQAVIDFVGELWNKIKKPIDDFVKAINKALSKIKDVTIEIGFKFAGGLGLFGKKSNNKLTGIMGEVKLPKLASGGIVNNPGSGVMMGNYIAGEQGPEAVLPLTDGTLQKLANMIPITVNVTNTMNGRVISKELQKVQNENNFAYNR